MNSVCGLAILCNIKSKHEAKPTKVYVKHDRSCILFKYDKFCCNNQKIMVDVIFENEESLLSTDFR